MYGLFCVHIYLKYLRFFFLSIKNILDLSHYVLLQGLRTIGGDWRPVGPKHQHQLRLPSQPTSAYYVELGSNKKHFRVDPAPSNKVEVFAPAPPSILGSFSGFGHDTVKSRHPVKQKKPYKESFQQAESRPGYPPDLLSPPYRHIFPQPFKQPDNVGQAYFFEASLSPPPRDSGINLVPPPSSKLAPNSYYLQFDQQSRPKPTASSFSPYLRQSLPQYGTSSDYFKASPSSDPFRFYTPEPTNKLHLTSRPGTTNSHGRPPGIDYFGNNPFGDIHLNTNRPEVKTPAKDVFEQLAPLGRPFQSSTIEPPRFSSQPNEYSSYDYFSNSGHVARQTTPKPFRASPLINDPFPLTERPSVFVTPETIPSRDVYPIPVTTLDIPSREEIYHKRPPGVSTYQSLPNTQQYHEEVTNKPALTTYYKRPEVEINNHHENSYQTQFLPTPASNVDSFVGEPQPTEFITPSSETNEVHRPTRPSRPRNKKKPLRRPENQNYGDTTQQNRFDIPITEYTIVHDENPKITTYDTLQNNYHTEPEQEVDTEQNKFVEKPKRRRPARPNNYYGSSTFTNTEQDIPEAPTALSTLPEEEVKTSLPSSSTTEFEKTNQRRRKKPTNRIRGPTRHGFNRSTTTTTTEPPVELTSNDFTQTEYQTLRQNVQTENYPFNGLAFNEYGHVMLQNSEENGPTDINVNTLYPTSQIDEYQTNYRDIITTTTTTEPTTIRITTTPAPETTLSTTTSRSRIRNKYTYNNTRPRFSVKDYRERLNKATSSTTESTREESEDAPRTRPTRLRGRINYKQSENQEDQPETSTRRFKPSYTGQRHGYRTTSTTTQSPLVQLDTPTTTERSNAFKPNVQRRPSPNKYYSRYRTSTEEPTAAAAEQPAVERLPQRPKGVFSAKKRRPFPLRTRVEPTKASEDDDLVEPHAETDDNALDHDQFTRKSDSIATTTLMTSSEEEDWRTSSAKPDVHALDTSDHGDITKKIADLTSSPSNSFDSSGFFKGVSPSSSRRAVSQITLATEDPILPIEAFFSSSFNRNEDSR